MFSTAHSQCHTYSGSCGSNCAVASSSVRDMAEEEVPATQPENHDAEDSQPPGDAFLGPVPEVPDVPDEENQDGPDGPDVPEVLKKPTSQRNLPQAQQKRRPKPRQ